MDCSKQNSMRRTEENLTSPAGVGAPVPTAHRSQPATSAVIASFQKLMQQDRLSRPDSQPIERRALEYVRLQVKSQGYAPLSVAWVEQPRN